MNELHITYSTYINNPGDCTPITAAKIFTDIKNGRWETVVNKCRTITNKDEYKKYKTDNIPAVLFGGVFSYRSANNLKKHSGLICIDIDNISDVNECKKEISKLPYAMFTAKSVGGKGVFVVCRIKPCTADVHSEYYRQISQDIPYKVDAAPKSIASARFVSFDPDAIYRPDAIPFELKEKKEKPKKLNTKAYNTLNADPTETKVQRLINEIRTSGVALVPSYEEYLRLAFAFATMGENGRNYFHSVCEVSPKYNHTETDKKFDHALKKGDGRISIGTFFSLCADAGLDVTNHEGEFPKPLVSWDTKEKPVKEEQVKRRSKTANIGSVWLPKTILKQYEEGRITDNEYLDKLQKDFEKSGLTDEEYVRKTNGGLAWELEAKEILMKFRKGKLDQKTYNEKAANICLRYELQPETVVNFLNLLYLK